MAYLYLGEENLEKNYVKFIEWMKHQKENIPSTFSLNPKQEWMSLHPREKIGTLSYLMSHLQVKIYLPLLKLESQDQNP